MKKLLKIIGIIVLCIIIIPLIVGLFISKNFDFETSIIIKAPLDSVWKHTNTLAGLNSWSPWRDMDPDMTVKYGGIDGEVGAWQSWESEVKKVGSGKQTIVSVETPTSLKTYVEFYSPYESEADGYVKLTNEGDETIVIWGVKSIMPYPFNLMKLFYSNADMVEPFQIGLKKLKKLSEDMII